MSDHALHAFPRGGRQPVPAGSSRGEHAPASPRICFVGLQNLPVLSPAYGSHGIGGEQVQQTLLACALASRGFAVSMVVADYGQPDAQTVRGVELFKAYQLEAGVPVLRFVHPRLTRLWAALARADADVYYVSIAGPQVGIVALFALLHGRRLVFRIASDADCDPRRLLIRHARDRWLYAFGLRHAQVLLAQSVQQVQSMQAHYALQARLASMLVEPPGPWIPFEQRDIDVLWVGNMLPLKRPHWVLDLARRVPELRVHVVGGAQPGHQALWDDVAAEARGLANVRFHGRLPYHDVHQLFDRTRVFVNTSEVEGFPNGFLQAWQRGAPVVSFFDPDHVIAQGGLGAAVTSMDELVREATHLAHSADDWQAASARCRRYMADHHGEDQVLVPYLQSLAPQWCTSAGIAHPGQGSVS
jgi:hypothetical protein